MSEHDEQWFILTEKNLEREQGEAIKAHWEAAGLPLPIVMAEGLVPAVFVKGEGWLTPSRTIPLDDGQFDRLLEAIRAEAEAEARQTSPR